MNSCDTKTGFRQRIIGYTLKMMGIKYEINKNYK